MTEKLSTEPYKGVRDFYPEDMAIQKHIFDVWRKVAESYGYEEYGASILEPSELYRSKTSDEIVNDQTYTFIDRGDREVTLRPEMTPTVARMVAGRRRELSFPLRWYSIPNCFRYERPQRGRVREFWQLNVDIFGVDSSAADIEIVSIAHGIMRTFGANESDFEIRINSRVLLQTELGKRLRNVDSFAQALRLIDKKDKLPENEFEAEWNKLSDQPFTSDFEMNDELRSIIDALASQGIRNVVFDPVLTRGFDYYTGMVFEVFDTSPENPRSLFGGGRYDRLLENFGGESLPAVGFGSGDVIMRDFLETHGLLPQELATTDLMLCVVDEKGRDEVSQLAQRLRAGGVRTATYEGAKKLGDQIGIASKKGIPFIVCVGEKESQSGTYILKELSTGNEMTLDMAGITAFFRTR